MKKNYYKENIENIKGSQKFNSNFQLVSQYLKLLDDNSTINEENIFVYFEKISEFVFDDNKKNTKISIIEGQPEGIEKGMEKLEAIDNEIGNQLNFKKYFKENENDQCTFYQLNYFINVLGEQLKFLCGNYNLNAENL